VRNILQQFLFFIPLFIFALEGEVLSTQKTLDHETVVFITGASNGIGLAAAERFAQNGVIVIVTARTPENSPKLLALAKKHPNLLVKTLDVTDSEENIQLLIQSIGKIDPDATSSLAIEGREGRYTSVATKPIVAIKKSAKKNIKTPCPRDLASYKMFVNHENKRFQSVPGMETGLGV
jgi:hypothetical protein